MKTGGTNLAWVSERHLRVSFESPDAADRVAHAYAALRAAGLAAVSDLTPASATILIHVDPRQAPEPVEQSVRAALRHAPTDGPATAPREIEVPVCYGGPMGPDLAEVARLHGLTEPQAVELHARPLYTVRFLGFSPGFPYLSGLPPALATPRLDTPRPSVPAGSIAIAGDQAGIYPRPTAGGWRILGRTPLSLFDPARTNPVLLRPGDRLRFRPITPDAFERLAREPRG